MTRRPPSSRQGQPSPQRGRSSHAVPGPDPRRWNRVDTAVLAAVAVLIATSAVVGLWFNANGRDLVLPGPPLLAFWFPHVGW